MGETLIEALERAAKRMTQYGKTYDCLSLSDVSDIAGRKGLSTREVSLAALEKGFLPLRYASNIGTIGLDGQAGLLRSRAVVVGAGGIGGQALELLARMGVGTLVVVDPDVFEATNLNRQNFSSSETLGLAKVDVARDRILEINSDVAVERHRTAADPSNLPGLLKNADVVIDALDSIDDRLVLQRACADLKLVMVHGAMAGSALEVTTIFPGDAGISSFAPKPIGNGKTRGIEVITGIPTATPALAAAIQVSEAVKVMLGRVSALRGKMFYMDTDDWTVEFIELDSP